MMKKKIEFDISVEDFDISQNYLETIEDLDEKTIMYIEREIRNL